SNVIARNGASQRFISELCLIMDRYLVISNHTSEDCRMAVEHFANYHSTFMTHFEWGCFENDHNSYALIETDNHEPALMSVPPLLRSKAKAIQVTHITLDMVKDKIHQKQ